MNKAPLVSLVAVGRNDDYGGDFKARLQIFTYWSVHQLTKNKIQSELIFVNYNPVDGKPIEDFIQWPTSNEWVTVRIITVPPSQHKTIVSELGNKDVPVLEYVAKNIGIRRARGKFILSMNPDILISEQIFSAFNSLERGKFYRANRLDYNGNSDVNLNDELYVQLRDYVTSIWFKGSHTNVSGFSLQKYKLLWFFKNIANWWKRNTVHLDWILKRINITTYYHNMQFKYHSNACGDFMLMDRESWAKLKGYKEASYISLHTDSLMIIQAAFSGLTEEIFTAPIFHRQHERRFDAHNRLTEDQIKVYHQYNDDVEKMKAENRPIVYNSENWGCQSIEFAEQRM